MLKTNTKTKKSVTELAARIREANAAYYSDGVHTSTLTDDAYDALCAELAVLHPNHPALSEGHTRQSTHQKTVLPYELWSLDKIKPDASGALAQWQKQFAEPPAYLIACKLDGISALCQGQGQGQSLDKVRIYTRGNGRVGQDISHLRSSLNLCYNSGQPWAVRGEIIMKRAVFQAKYRTQFANARNLVGGIIQKKVATQQVSQQQAADLSFVAYEVLEPAGLTPVQQMAWLIQHGFEVAPHLVWSASQLTQPALTQQLLYWRQHAVYENDGVVVTHDAVHPRNKDGNPSHAFAYKMQLGEQTTRAHVVAVHWSPSKDGYLKPRVQFTPVQLGGVKIEYATGFNAKFIKEQKLGPGAVVELVRSGDVIPHIVRVLEPSTAPVVLPPGTWTPTGVDLQSQDAASIDVKVLTNLFAHLGVEGVGPGVVQKMYAAGYQTLPQILALDMPALLQIEGFQTTLAEKVYTKIHERVAQASLAELMHASNLLGRGYGLKKITAALHAGTPWPWPSKNQDAFDAWLLACGLGYKKAEQEKAEQEKAEQEKAEQEKAEQEKAEQEKETKEEKHNSKKYVLTGFRDKILVAKLAAYGAEECATVSKNTWCVIVKDDKANDSSKVRAARQLNVPIKTVAEIEALL